MLDNNNLSILNSLHILCRKKSERKLVKWVQVGVSRYFFLPI